MMEEKITVPEQALSRSSGRDAISPYPNDASAFEMEDLNPPCQTPTNKTKSTTSARNKSGLAELWNQHVSISVPYEKRRDHLGKFCTQFPLPSSFSSTNQYSLRLTQSPQINSPRAHIPRLPPHIPRARHRRRDHRATAAPE
jgi:hypothetical protein